MKKAVAAILLQVLPLLSCTSCVHAVDTKDYTIIEGRRYYFSNVRLSVPEALTLCLELNMTLAGLETPAEYDAVTDYIRFSIGGSDPFWTSGSRHYTTWIWSNSGQPITFFRWDVGQPQVTDGTTQQDLNIGNGLMRDAAPSAEERFICEERSC